MYIRDHLGKSIIGFIRFPDLGVAITYHRQVAGDRAELDETAIGTADLADTVPQIVTGEIGFKDFKRAFVAAARLEQVTTLDREDNFGGGNKGLVARRFESRWKTDFTRLVGKRVDKTLANGLEALDL